MKNIATTTPAFVLTSLSYKMQGKEEYPGQNIHLPKSSISKFDYCLPPEAENIPHGTKYSGDVTNPGLL